jgi:exonuclease SbcD
MTVGIIVGDVHLGKGVNIGKPGIGNALNSRVLDQVKLLDWIVDQCLSVDAELIILTGDIWEDVKPHYALVDLFFKFLKRCKVNNIEVHVIAGNHDIKRSGANYSSPLDLIETADFDNVFVYKNINTIHRDGVSFTMMPFRDRRSLDKDKNVDALSFLYKQLIYESSSIPINNDKVLIGHLAIEGSLFVGDEIDSHANELMCPVNMFKDYDYVWMGHVHRPQVRSREPYVAHIGSMDLSDFGETNHKKILIHFDTENDSKFNEIEVPSRPLRKLSLQVLEGFDPTEFVLDKINEINKVNSFKNSIVKIELHLLDPSSKNVDRKKIENCLIELGVYYICSFSESKNILVVPLEKQTVKDNSIDPRTAIKLYANDQLKLSSKKEKSKFISISNEIVDQYLASITR